MNLLQPGSSATTAHRLRWGAVWLFYLLPLLFAPRLAAAHWSGAAMMNSYGGPTYAVAARDHWAYYGEGPSLVVMDISDPAQPVVTGKTLLDYGAFNIKITGNLAIVAVENLYGGHVVYGLDFVDISDPAAPHKLSFYPLSRHVYGLSIEENIVCVTTLDSLLVLDISNPAQPRLRSMLSGDYSTAYLDVELSGGIAYVSISEFGLRIYDLSNPDKPVLRSGYHMNFQNFQHLALFGKTVFLDVGGMDMIFDVSNPDIPRIIGNTDINMVDAIFDGNLAYVIPPGDLGIQLVDVSNPSTPRLKGYVTRAQTFTIALTGHTLVACDNQYVRLHDITDPVNAQLLFTHRTWSEAATDSHVALDGNVLYYSNVHSLSAFDISRPPQPRLLSKINVYSGTGCIDVRDGLALQAKVTGLLILDVSDPANPRQRSSITLPEVPYGIARQGNLALLVLGTKGFQIVDFSDPDHLVARGSLPIPDWAIKIAVAGNLAYVADEGGGLLIIDFQDPDHPVLRGKLDQISNVWDVAVSGGTAYLIVSGQNDPEVLMTVDVRNPADPKIIKNTLVNLGTREIRLAGQTLLLAGTLAGPAAYDVRDPAQPKLLFDYPIAGLPVDLVTAGDWAYIAGYDSELSVVQLLSPIQVLSPNGGELMRGGETAQVHWKCDPTSVGTAARLELWNAQGLIAQLGTAQAPTGDTVTAVSLPLVPETPDYFIRAVSVQDDYFYDDSDAPFTVTGGPLRVLAPTGGEIWTAGDKQTIHWRSGINYSGTAVWLELWRGGRRVASLGPAWDATGERVSPVTVPAVAPGGDYAVRAVSAWYPAWFAESAGPITIRNDTWVQSAVAPKDWSLYR